MTGLIINWRFVMPSSGDIVTASGIDTTYVNAAGDVMAGALDVQGKNPFPVGGIYFQLPGESEPSTLFVGTWTNISSNFEGVFFRVEGGNANSFNSGVQLDAFQGHEHTTDTSDDNNDGAGGYSDRPINTDGTTKGIVEKSGYGSPRYANETRPKNVTIRVWRRTA